MNFWERLPTPCFVVAPMADVTDAAFRRMLATYGSHERQDGTIGGPDVMWTEFVAADGLVRATPEGKQKLMADLIYSEVERPVVAQLFTSNPEHMEYAANLCLELGFDGIDINMGCPDRSIEKQGCGSAMIKTPEVARHIIQAAKRGAKSDDGGIPVSVKTRVGYNKDEIDTWIPVLLSENIAALTIHARTRKELSKAPAQWERVARVVALRDALAPHTRIIGNGDVLSLDDARQKVQESGADGAMIGRALFGNPWFFHPAKSLPHRLNALPTSGVDREKLISHDVTNTAMEYVPLEERLRVMVEHTKLFEELLPHKNFAVMKKHYKAYVNGFPGAADLRHELMQQNSATEIEGVVHSFLTTNKGNALD
jgi:tRNA-dihydrouridine synthase